MKSFRMIYRLAEYDQSRKNIINFLSLSTKRPIFKKFWIRVVIFFIQLLFIAHLYWLCTMLGPRNVEVSTSNMILILLTLTV